MLFPSLDLTKTAFDISTLRKPGVAVGGGALLGAGLGAGIGALTADPEEGDSRWGRAGLGALVGGAAGAGAGAASADWGTHNPFAKPPKPGAVAHEDAAKAAPSNTTPKNAPKLKPQPQRKPAPEKTPAPEPTSSSTAPKTSIEDLGSQNFEEFDRTMSQPVLNEHGETHQTYSIGKFDDYRFNPNQAYSINHNGVNDVVRFVGEHPDSEYAIPQFESLTRSGVGRKRGEALRFFVASPDEVKGPMYRLQTHKEITDGMAADQNHPAINYVRTGNTAHLNPIRTKATTKEGAAMKPELWDIVEEKFASFGGRVVGGMLHPYAGLAADHSFNAALDASDLTPIERLRVESQSGVRDGLESSARGTLRGSLEGLVGGGLGALAGNELAEYGDVNPILPTIGGGMAGMAAGALHGGLAAGSNTGKDVADRGIERAHKARAAQAPMKQSEAEAPEFWATEYTKLAGPVGRLLGHGIIDPDPVAALSAHRGFKDELAGHNLSPEEQQYAEDQTGFGSGLRAGAYGLLGGTAGALAGSIPGRLLQSPGTAAIGGIMGAVGGGVLGAGHAGHVSARHRLEELQRLGLAQG